MEATKGKNYLVFDLKARDLLTVQASTVAAEYVFSLSGRIISERRTRLSDESVEVCVCLKGYFDSVERVQDKKSLEDALDDLEDEIIEAEKSTLTTPNHSSDDANGNDPTNLDSIYEHDDLFDIDAAN